MTKIKYQSTITSIAIHRSGGSPIFDEGVTNLRVWDNGSGAFLILSQNRLEGMPEDEVWLDPEGLEMVVNEARRMLLQAAFAEASSDED